MSNQLTPSVEGSTLTDGELSGVFLAGLDHPPYKVLGNGLLLLLLLAIAFFSAKTGLETEIDSELIGKGFWFIICGIAIFLGYLTFDRTRQAVHSRFGLSGSGLRVFDSGEIAIAGIQPGPNGASDPLNSVVLKSEGQRYAGKDVTILVNVLRTVHGNWAIGHLVMTNGDGQSLLKLEFVKTFIVPGATSPTTKDLYVAERGRFDNLLSSDPIGDIRKLSTVLRASGARLELTFTEFSPSGVGGVFGRVATGALSKSKQAKANLKLEAGQLPVEAELQDGLDAVVKEFRYKLIPNNQFRPLGFCADK